MMEPELTFPNSRLLLLFTAVAELYALADTASPDAREPVGLAMGQRGGDTWALNMDGTHGKVQ